MEETISPASLLGLPYEIQQKVAMDLDIQSTLNLCLGAKALESSICKDDTFWREKYQQDLGTEKVLKELDWFQNYRIKAIGVMDFEYDVDASEVYVKIGDRIIFVIPEIDPEILRTGFLNLFLKDLGPLDILNRIEDGLELRLSYQSNLKKNKDLPIADKFVIVTLDPDSDMALSYLYLTRREALRLIATLYEDYYIAFFK